MMKSFNEFLVTIAVFSASFQMPSIGAATVTASKNYVDRQTTLHPYSNGVEQVGYFLGTQTNKVLLSAQAAPTPGNYLAVSNAAMSARCKGDLDVYSYAPFLIYSYGDETFSPPMRMNYETIRYAGGGNETGWISETQINGEFQLIYNDLTSVVYLEKSGGEYIVVSGNPITVSSDGKAITQVGATQVDIRRESTGIDFATGDRLATTSEIPHAVSVVVVSPSTNATPGAAADAKATGTALYTGFTEWEFSGDNPYEYDYKNLWVDIIPDDGSFIYVLYDSYQMVSAVTRQTSDEISVSYDYVSITATRHLVTPTKTSQLVNDGTNGAPFVTSSELEKKRDVTDLSIRTVPTDSNGAEFMVNGVLSGPYDPDGAVGWAPSGGGWVVLWQSAGHYTLNAGGGYADFTISQSNGYANNVSINGTSYHIVGVSTNSIATTAQLPQNYDIVSNRAMSSIGTNALANNPTYDFSKNYDIIRATADIVQLLGGTVTNNPTANQGGN